ncbi:MAG: hypothetical protein RBR43_09615 [Desulfuromonadaceae bacterium]|nr:hypothetical protein [Desulfuromonas sp.]MDY0186123.1 hypothetical protein [Desulfuromonadaceae bacterium]
MDPSYTDEENFLNIARDLDFDSLDYDKVLRKRARITYALVGVGSCFIIIGFAFLVAELLTLNSIAGSTSVFMLLISGILIYFVAARHQRKLETIITYEILQRIRAIEGRNGFLWRIGNSLNACCQEEYGGIPEEVFELQTSSQAGGIESDEIRLYKDFLEKVVQWHEKHKKEDSAE